MTETVVHLRWDGVCIPAGEQEHSTGTRLWRNSKALGPCLGAHPPDHGRKPVYVRPGTKPAEADVIRQQRAEIAIVYTTANFAPGQEWMWVQASISNIHNVGGLVLQIRDTHGTLVYTERLSQRQVWGLPRRDPTQNAPAPPLEYQPGESAEKATERARLQWANPAGSPYQVKILITRRVMGGADSIRGVPTLTTNPMVPGADFVVNAPQQPDQTNVAIVSLGLDLVPWSELYQLSTGLPAATIPEDGANRVKWVQYKLNDLGWFAGKLDGDPNNPDLRKAIIRYRQSSKELNIQDFTVQDNSGLFYRNTDASVVPSPSIDDGLLEELEDGLRARSTSEAGVFTGTAGKIHLDVERFSRDANTKDAQSDFANDPATATSTFKYDKEQDWLSTPRFPLRAKVEVRGSHGNPVWSPATSQSTRVEWAWQSEAEDTTGLTSPHSTTRSYVDRAKAQFPTNRHNAHVDVGGQLRGDGFDASVVFDRIDVAPTITAAGVATAGPLVFFESSKIAGDRYRITATVQAAAGPVHATTGMMTLWRRIHVRGHVSWGGQPSDVWNEVAAKYAAAYVELVPPTAADTKTMAALALLRPDLKRAFEAGTERATWGDDAWDSRRFAIQDFTKTTPEIMAAKLEAILDGNDEAYTLWRDGAEIDIDIGARYKLAMAVLGLWGRGRDDDRGGPSLSDLVDDMNLRGGKKHYMQELKRICELPKEEEPKPSSSAARPAFLAGIGKPTAAKPAFLAGIGKPTAASKAEPEGEIPAPSPPTLFKQLPKNERGIVRWEGAQDAIANALKEKVKVDSSNRIMGTQASVLVKLHDILGPGIAVLEFEPHGPVDIGTARAYKSQNASSHMAGAGKVLINRACFDTYRADHLFTHEIGHALFLKHYKNAPDQVAEDHDFSDDNCVMSYVATGPAESGTIASTAAHYRPGNYDPRFCGKCNLKLRGWNIRAPGMPTKANDADPDPIVTP